MRRYLIGLLAAIVFAGPLFTEPLFAEASPAERSQTGPLFKKGTVTISQGGRSARLNVEIAETPAGSWAASALPRAPECFLSTRRAPPASSG